jgi:DNA-directed RNA polymerase subunit RPC12/RpoP
MNFNCPTCGAQVKFASPAPYAVCGYCRSVLVRTDVRVDSVGKVAMVPDDFSPLQLGTRGRYGDRSFALVGRIRKVWSEGGWNEWCAHFNDGALGWLAEAQGDLVMTFERPMVLPPAALAPDSVVTIEGQRFQVSEIKEVSLAGAEGEIASYSPDTHSTTSIDLRGPGLAFATIERSDTTRVFVGQFVEFDACRFTQLRAMDGWTPGSAPSSR